MEGELPRVARRRSGGELGDARRPDERPIVDAVGGYRDLAKYTTLGGTLFVFSLPGTASTTNATASR